jgi:adenylosuccinate synthase
MQVFGARSDIRKSLRSSQSTVVFEEVSGVMMDPDSGTRFFTVMDLPAGRDETGSGASKQADPYAIPPIRTSR